jgi:hypothetical protein
LPLSAPQALRSEKKGNWSWGKATGREVAGVQELQELQNKNRNRGHGPAFLIGGFTEAEGVQNAGLPQALSPLPQNVRKYGLCGGSDKQSSENDSVFIL